MLIHACDPSTRKGGRQGGKKRKKMKKRERGRKEGSKLKRKGRRDFLTREHVTRSTLFHILLSGSLHLSELNMVKNNHISG